MKNSQIKRFLKLLPEMTDEQISLLEEAVKEAVSERSSCIEKVLPVKAENPVCPHCYQPSTRYGQQNGLQRYRCKSCRKTFNALTGTELARLRHRDKWVSAGRSMLEGDTLKVMAEKVGVCVDTAFRWRHRFLKGVSNQANPVLGGIVEVDETLFRHSAKGQPAVLRRKPRKRGGSTGVPGRSAEQVLVCVARDRNRQTIHCVTGTMNQTLAEEILEPVLQPDSVLCSDGLKAYQSFAGKKNVHHVILNASRQEYVKEGVFHIQNVNAYHKRLKGWMDRFNGVSTKYLPSYVEWFRHRERILDRQCKEDPVFFVQLALSNC